MGIPILTTLAGSRAYHMEREDSDYDYHHVFITPTVELLKLGPTPKQTLWKEDTRGDDTQGWELGHFLHLALKCNPTILETFVAPIVKENYISMELPENRTLRYKGMVATDTLIPEATELRALFPFVLSRKRVFDAFRGYAHNQRAKLFKKPDDPTRDQPSERVWKFATQYLRVLMIGERLLSTGEMVIDMRKYDEQYRGYGFGFHCAWLCLCSIRDGDWSLGEVIDMAKKMEDLLEHAYETSQIPKEPDLDKINEYLIRMRRRYWV